MADDRNNNKKKPKRNREKNEKPSERSFNGLEDREENGELVKLPELSQFVYFLAFYALFRCLTWKNDLRCYCLFSLVYACALSYIIIGKRLQTNNEFETILCVLSSVPRLFFQVQQLVSNKQMNLKEIKNDENGYRRWPIWKY